MRKGHLVVGISLGLLLCSVAVTMSVLWYLFSRVSTSSQTSSFIITKGDSVSSIATKLQSQGFVRSALSIRVLYKLDGHDIAIQPGTYKIAPAMTPKEILGALFSETQDVWVTFQEGWRTEEYAAVLGTKLHAAFDPEVFITLARPVEGKLFPDTYLLSKDMDAAAVFAKLTSTFSEKFASALKTDGPGVLPKAETIILASLVEREGRGEADSRMIAGILKNRLDAAMPLQVDATLQYATGYDKVKKTWWGVPKASDKEAAGAYNTYANPGLPPGAICNPGLLSLRAALAPTPSDYLFYLHDPAGKPHYAKTYAEHQKNIDMYLR